MSNPFATIKPASTRQQPSPDETQAVIEKLVRVAPPLIRQAYATTPSTSTTPVAGHPRERPFYARTRGVTPVHECTRMTRLAYDTLHLLGIPSEPLFCTLTAWNAHFETWRTTGVDHPLAYRHTLDPRILEETGIPFALMSHVVIYVPSVQQIVDLAAWQLSRPAWGLQLPAALALPWDGTEATFASATGYITYEAWPPDIPLEPLAEHRNWVWGMSRDFARKIANKIPTPKRKKEGTDAHDRKQ